MDPDLSTPFCACWPAWYLVMKKGASAISLGPVLNSPYRTNGTLELATNRGNLTWERPAEFGTFNSLWATMFGYTFKNGLRNSKMSKTLLWLQTTHWQTDGWNPISDFLKETLFLINNLSFSPAKHSLSLSLSSPGNMITVVSIQQLYITQALNHPRRQRSIPKVALEAGFRVLACSHNSLWYPPNVDEWLWVSRWFLSQLKTPTEAHPTRPQPAPILLSFAEIPNMAMKDPSAI